MSPLAIAGVGAAVVTVGFASVGVVFVVGWVIEAKSKRDAQALLARKNGGAR